MKTNFLVTGKLHKNYPKKSRLIFVSKFDLKIKITGKTKLFNQFEYYYDFLKDPGNMSDIDFMKKKISKYRKELGNKLNKAHNVNYGENYWGLLLDKYLFILSQVIFFNYRAIKSILKKYKYIELKETKLFVPRISNFKEFAALEDDPFISNYIKTKILLFFKKKNIKLLEYRKSRKSNKESIFQYVARKACNMYLKLFKPILLLNSYIGKKNSLKIFFLSFGKILSVPEKFIFNPKNDSFNFNHDLRKIININLDDEFDEIFNQINQEVMPASILENFNKYNLETNLISKFVNKLGSAILLINNDSYKFLSANIIQKKGKIFSLQHGANIGIFSFSIQEEIEKKYCHKRFYWSQKDGIGNTFLQNLKDFKNKTVAEKILILSTASHFHDFSHSTFYKMYLKKYHPTENLNYCFYESLSKPLKKKITIKLFPKKESLKVKKFWEKKYGNNLDIIDDKDLNSYNLFKETKIVILDDFSTPLCELLFINKPTIVICESLTEYNKSFLKKIKKLKKLNFFFQDPKTASKFLNKNFENIDLWWDKITSDQDFKKFRDHLFTDSKKFSYSKLAKSIMKI